MKKIIFSTIAMCLLNLAVFAGDVAVFQDIGFSKDGKYYVFGEYGKNDKAFTPYGEIYTVDVAKNDFVSGKVFKFTDNSFTKKSKEIYEELYAKRYADISKYECYVPKPEDVLYILEEESKGYTDEIVFNSFEESNYEYHVKLIPTMYGKKSSFVINVKIYDENGELKTSYEVGTPSVKRPNVTKYRIVKISTSQDKKSVVFVVEKTIEDDKGVSIRYMVETKRLSEPVDGKNR